MKAAPALLILFGVLAFFPIRAQRSQCDTLVLNDGATITGVIEKITAEEIQYSPCANPNAALRAIKKSRVLELRSKKGVKVIESESPAARFGAAFEKSDTAQVWQIVTLDGNSHIGKILDKTQGNISLQTQTLGLITIPYSQIKTTQLVHKSQVIDGDFWYESPHNTRYFWSPSGYGLHKGEGYYQNIWVLFNQVSYGFTDYFSLGVGILPTFFFGGSGFPFWVTPKVSVPIAKDKFNFGAGVLYINGVGDFSGTNGVGLGYGVLTAGSRDRNFSLGFGFGFSDGEQSRAVVINASGCYRVSKKFSLLTENYIIPLASTSRYEAYTVGILSVGGRYGGRNIAVDFGLFAPIDEGIYFALPWLGLNVPFGHRRK